MSTWMMRRMAKKRRKYRSDRRVYHGAMKHLAPWLAGIAAVAVTPALTGLGAWQAPASAPAPLVLPQERHLTNMQQLTFGGENAEAYFSFDGQYLSFQSSKDHPCDQIYTMKIDGTGVKRLSNGQGRTTCSHFMPDGKSVVYASTFLGGADC